MSELLAPCGSYEALTAAVRCGADAVYLGGKDFSARQNAGNFSDEELKSAAELCHLHGMKIYRAINTLVFDSQLEEVKNALRVSAECGVDGLIIQDLGIARLAREIIPDMPLHASTQMTIYSPAGAKIAREMGFVRVVAARELPLENMRELALSGAEVESFIHGAQCMCVSGQCLLSAAIGGRSANRGRCAQPCRLPFSALAGAERYDLSLKDMSLFGRLNEMKDAGVVSFKIEGRMKRPEYVAAAVTAYRHELDGEGNPDDERVLRSVFSRSGFTHGYLDGAPSPEMFGVRSKEDVVAAAEVLPQLQSLCARERKCADIRFFIEIHAGEPVRLSASDGSRMVIVTGAVPEKAINRPTDLSSVERQLSKLGDTIYSLAGVRGNIEDGLIIPAAELNRLRREAVAQLDRERIAANTPKIRFIDKDISTVKLSHHAKSSAPEIRVRLERAEDIKEVPEEISSVILPLRECFKIPPSERIIIAPPAFSFNEEELRQNLHKLRSVGFSRLLCENISHIFLGREEGFTLHGSARLNVTNSYALAELRDLGLYDCTLSAELRFSQINSIDSEIPTGIIAHGYLPLMMTVNCPIKNRSGCKGCRKEQRYLTDRTGEKFRVLCPRERGLDYAELLNPHCLYTADKLGALTNAAFIELRCPAGENISEIVRKYQSGEKNDIYENTTCGLYFRGVK